MKPHSKKNHVYREFRAPADLDTVLEKIWTFETVQGSLNDGNFTLMADFTSSLIFLSYPGSKKSGFYLTGPNLINLPLRSLPGLKAVAFRFMPLEANRILNISPSETINSIKELSLLTKTSQLKESVSGSCFSEGTREFIRYVCEILRCEKKPVSEREKMIQDFTNRIIADEGNVKLEKEYSALPCSRRQFQRNFVSLTGITPKEFCRVARVHFTTRNLVRSNFRHFDILVEAGYYDQSHYYREFRKFIGMLPSRFENRQKLIEHEKLID